jgi:hypothetical protein
MARQELMDRDIQTKGEYFLTDALNLMIEDGENCTQTVAREDCGKPEIGIRIAICWSTATTTARSMATVT